MFTNERATQIIEWLKLQKRATVQELAKLLYVSEATIRRDLIELSRMGLVSRTHGGCILAENTTEVSIIIRESVNATQKAAAAQIALPRLPEFRTVFIDNSSTVKVLAEKLDFSNKTVVTNGLSVASMLARRGNVTVILPGGEFQDATSLTGSMTCRNLREFRFDLALCSCAHLGPEGSFENSLATREEKAAALEVSLKRILIVDQTKLHSGSPFRVAPLSFFDCIFTDAADEDIKPLQDAGGHIVNG